MFDLIVLGGGPAGYVAAERAGEMGKKVLLIEKAHLGGVCLNSGCIPTKSMLFCAKTYDHALHAEAYGVKAQSVTFDFGSVKARTEGIQEKLRLGIAALMKMNKVEVITGEAKLTSSTTVAVGDQSYTARHILIATGSHAYIPPIPGLKGNEKVVTHVEMLKQKELVNHLVIIGGGVIGTEFASVYAMLGKKVTVIEMLPQICGATDKELAKTVEKKLAKKGVDFKLSTTVTRVEGGTVHFTEKTGTESSVVADLILVATGRTVNTAGIGLETVGVDFSRKGIKVNDYAATNVPGIYAAGDVTGHWQLAHFASRQGSVAVNAMFGHPELCRETAIPAVVYTDPEIACIGLTEDLAKERGITVKTAKFPFSNNGRYLAESDGDRALIKVVIGGEHGELLGVHMVGPHVSEMIATAAVMIEQEMCLRDIKEIVFPHPTVVETMRDVLFQFH